jgi:hypothetical protein
MKHIANTGGMEVAGFLKTSLWILYFTLYSMTVKATGNTSVYIELMTHIFGPNAITLSVPANVTETSNSKKRENSGNPVDQIWIPRQNLLGRKLIGWYTVWINPKPVQKNWRKVIKMSSLCTPVLGSDLISN